MTEINELFEKRTIFPDVDAKSRLSRLVGMDERKLMLTKIIGLLVNPTGLTNWLDKKHPDAYFLAEAVLRRPPLIILAGDVGSGKSELAETIGDAVARQENIEITLLPMSLSTRGQGRVGEMTQLVTAAFDTTLAEASKLKSIGSSSRGAVILLIDEADALAQSREASQMHHEDRAGVNAFIRGIDRIAQGQLPAAVIMCTNRLNALDPAIRRRAAEIVTFQRPTLEQRAHLLNHLLKPAGLSTNDILDLARITGNSDDRNFGFTFSDISQRLIPSIVLDAYPNGTISASRAKEIASAMVPTKPFVEESI
ncbi:AAA family ATPase [Arsukibacterium indicum]|uniref:AAA family ATPase n=1 Tax=Arsukibacterium indicum TaxID=2848612 RepID=A0ABS6MJD3_9GAMM|nr:AAA family ATPase [Arsukibacterium indicum]MBV2128934.1 AAA family ATPase [Arsukibacterium indicum]